MIKMKLRSQSQSQNKIILKTFKIWRMVKMLRSQAQRRMKLIPDLLEESSRMKMSAGRMLSLMTSC